MTTNQTIRAHTNRTHTNRTHTTGGRRQRLIVAAALTGAFVAMTASAQIASPTTDALPPPTGPMSHGAAGTARNGFGGSIAPSPTSASWPGTGSGNNGGPFAFVGAQYGTMWNLPTSSNNSAGVGYCMMEDERGEGSVAQQPDPAAWDAGEMARAAAVMATFGGDRVVPYGVNDSGRYDPASGEWEQPMLFGGGEYTRRRQVAVNFAVRMFLDDLSPTGVAGGRKLARDTAVVEGSGGEFAALRNGYVIAQYLADVADVQHAVGGLVVAMAWGTPGGAPPTAPGTYPLEVLVTDGAGKRVGFVPVLQLSGVGIDGNRSAGAVARVVNGADAPADIARWNAATAAGWPVWGMNGRLTTDPRFEVGAQPLAADVADRNGVARFDVEITATEWDLAFHVQAPTSDVDLHSGSGIQGQVTWAGEPQSASMHQRQVVPDRLIAVAKTSTDPAVSVAGTVFALLDGSGDEIGRSTVGADGRAAFAPFSPAAWEPPYVLREISAAPGLERAAGDIAVPAELSTDASDPTVITVSNTASVGRFRVRKVLDDLDVQGGRDMSGFSFEITALATGVMIGTVVTGTDGRSPAVDAVYGEYRATEVGRPAWAAALGDPGPVRFRFDPAVVDQTTTGVLDAGVVDDGVLEIVYTNVVPDASITTSASDAADGDRYVMLADDRAVDGAADGAIGGEVSGAVDGAVGGQVVDAVSYCGMVPGTAYRVDGEIQLVGTSPGAPTPSGVRGVTTFVPVDPCGTIEVRFEVPPDSVLRGGSGVVFQRVVLAATGQLVAEHTDPNDAAQTITFPDISTDLHRADTDGAAPSDHLIAPEDAIVDVITYTGLHAGETYRADLTLHERLVDGTCVVTDVVAAREFTALGSSGQVTVDIGAVPGPGVYVGFEEIRVAGAMDFVAAHRDCNDRQQTVWAIDMATSVSAPTVVGAGEMVDMIAIGGLADGLPEGATAVVEGFLHRHDGADRARWTCATENRVGGFAGSVTTDGTHRSPGERHDLGWYSYDNRVVVTFADATIWASDWHGCTLEAESFEATAPPHEPPVATTPVPPVATTPVPADVVPSEPVPARRTPPALPRTGGTMSATILRFGAVFAVSGLAFAALSHRSRRLPTTAVGRSRWLPRTAFRRSRRHQGKG